MLFLSKLTGLVSILILGPLFLSCAVIQRSEVVPPNTDTFLIPKKVESLRNFELDIMTSPKGQSICQGMDGKNIYYLSRGIQLSIHIRFIDSPSVHFKPEQLIANIKHLEPIPFTQKTSETEYTTETISLDYLQDGLSTEPVCIFIYLRLNSNIYLLNKKELVIIDTTRPQKPENLRVSRRTQASYTLKWDQGVNSQDIRGYIVEQYQLDRWQEINDPIKVSEIRINETPQGLIRVVSIDCAYNKSEYSDIINPLKDECGLRLISTGKWSKMLADCIKNKMRTFGFSKIYDENDSPMITPYQLSIHMDIGQSKQEHGFYYWNVHPQIEFKHLSSEFQLTWNTSEAHIKDTSIFGDQTGPYEDGPNSFKEKIALHLIDSFFEKLDTLPIKINCQKRITKSKE